MSDETQAQVPPSRSREERLEQVLAEYLRRVEQGAPVDQQALLAAHPDLADDLREFFGNQVRMQRLVGAGSPPHGRNGTPTRLRYFGDYEILEVIAQGGMGVVYKARQTSLNRIVAVKMILAGQLANESDVKRFQAEAEAAANLHHPGVVGIYEVGVQDGQHYYSMEYIDGQNLSQAVREKPLSVTQAAEYVREMAVVLEYAHQQKVLHRDLKPSNILLDAAGRMRITDFGLAKRVEGESDLTITGQILGTPSYMSPEQAAAQHSIIGPSTDIYALGVILYELVTGRPPFRSEIVTETLRQVQHDEPVRPRLLNPKLPRDLETICLKCLEKEPRKRYASAESLADDLSRYLRGEPILARPISRPARMWRWCRRKPAVAGMLAISVSAVVLLIAGLAVSNALIARAFSERGEALTKLEQQQDVTNKAYNALSIQEGITRTALGRETKALARLKGAIEDLKTSVARERSIAYLNQIALAHKEYEANHLKRAEEILNECRPELRGWEWSYLKGLCNPVGLQAIPGGKTTNDRFQHVMSLATKIDRVIVVNPDDGVVRVLDLTTGTEVLKFTPVTPPSFITISPNGRWIALTGSPYVKELDRRESFLQIWDVEKNCEKRLFKFPWMSHSIEKLAISPDGVSLAATIMQWKKIGPEGGAMGAGSMLKMWDIETGEERLKSEFSENGGGLLAFSPDGKWLAHPIAAKVELWEVASGKVAKSLLTGGANCLEFRPDSLQVAIASNSGSVTLWDLVSGQQVQTLHGHAQSIYSISYRSDGMELATSGGDATIRLWETATGRETRVYRFRGNHSTVAFDRNDLRLVTIAGGGYNDEPVRTPLPRELTVWDAKTSPGVAMFPPPDDRGQAGRRAYELEFNRDGSLLACGRGNRLVIWDTATQQIVQMLFDKDHRPTVQMIGIAFDAAGGRVAAGYSDSESTAKVWDVKTGQLLHNLVGHRGRVHSLAFSPDGLTLATASQDATVRIWSLQDGKLKSELKVAQQDAHPLTKIIFRPGGRELAVGTRGGSIQIWDLATGKLRTAIGPKQDTYSIAYSRDGGWIASGANTRVTILNANTGELIREFKGHIAGVFDLCFSPDGRRLVSVGLGEARIWDSESGQQILMLSKVYAGAVRFDPKGNRIATLASSGVPQIWDASRFAIPANLPAVASEKVLP